LVNTSAVSRPSVSLPKKETIDDEIAVYPWGSQKGAKIVDVGGGIGAATFPILQANPDLRLTVQDIPDTGPEFQKVTA